MWCAVCGVCVFVCVLPFIYCTAAFYARASTFYARALYMYICASRALYDARASERASSEHTCERSSKSVHSYTYEYMLTGATQYTVQ
jgi:hypothetical protein